MAKEISKDVKSMGDAENNVETVQELAPKKGRRTVKEPTYPVSELAANAKKLFGTRQECAEAALRAAGKTGCTVAEAKGIIEKFLRKEVK